MVRPELRELRIFFLDGVPRRGELLLQRRRGLGFGSLDLASEALDFPGEAAGLLQLRILRG